MMRPGKGAILQAGDAIYLTGNGASPQGDRPFLDRLNLKSLATERVFQTDDKSYETVAALLSDDGKRLLTRWETKTDYPELLRARPRRRDAGRALTAVQGPGAAAHRHPEAARDLRPQGRREAVGHGLPAARLQARHAAAVRPLGLPGRVHRRGHREPGVGLAEPLHHHRRRVAPAVPHPGLRRDGQPDDADRRRGRNGERHLRRAVGGERRGGHRQDRRHGRGRSRPDRRGRATATGRS